MILSGRFSWRGLLIVCVAFLCGYAAAGAQAAENRPAISGTIVDGGAKHPVEFAAVILKTAAENTTIAQTTTDAQGSFALADVSPGNYKVVYGRVGNDQRESTPFSLTAASTPVNLGRLELADAPVQMEAVEVSTKRATLLNSIDRKTYNVGREIQSATGTASDLLQNVPSVNVDIDGGVSLRGSENVMILINGRSSVLMGRSRAEALQQLPADGIEKIEVITNPSAKYKPDGTAGIINIVLKRQQTPGITGTVNTSVGNEGRYNAGVSASYQPGKYNISGGVSVRQDDRRRLATDTRRILDAQTGTVITSQRTTEEETRPLTRIARLGFEYAGSENQHFGATVTYDRQTVSGRAIDRNIRSRDGIVTSDYDRTGEGPEAEESWEFSANYERKFAGGDRQLNVELETSRSREQEENRYADIFRLPSQSPNRDNTRSKNREREFEFSADYTQPMGDRSKVELGYEGSWEQLDTDFFAEIEDPATSLWLTDLTRTNRFIYEETIHAFYLTYGHTFGKFGFLAGARPEFARVKSNQVTTGTVIPNEYSRVYPSLHLAYRLTPQHEFQLNYSHRVERPDSDELNPFPEYSDPFNVSAGNPSLVPENVHSFEGGYAFHGDSTNLTATLYHRNVLNGFTSITREIGNGVLLTTQENLSRSHSSGLELTASGELGKNLSLNFSSNTYFNSLNTANLGGAGNRSDVSWSAKLGATLRLPRNTLMQVNTNYVSGRLTAQGSRRPSFVTNVGLRRELLDRKVAVLLTVSDVFNSQKDGSILETPTLRREVVRRRSARVVYVGLVYNFGKPPKKPREDTMEFDDAL